MSAQSAIQSTKLQPTVLKRALELMMLQRTFETKAGQAYGEKEIRGFCHLYIGQEAVSTGISISKKPGDAIITSYRDHGIMLALGTDPKVVMAELFGKRSGCSKGKGGSMHMFDIANGFYGGHGIVGAHVPIGTGIAFKFKYKKEKNIAVAILGDGAMQQGQVYESFNMAKLWGLPVLYVIENNGYGIGTPVFRSSCTANLHDRGISFAIPGVEVDGMDFIAVQQKVAQAMEYVRTESSPMLIEINTYRYRGHSMSDPGQYRTKEELNSYRDRDPIAQLKTQMEQSGLLSPDEFKQLDKKIRNLVQEAFDFAKNTPEPKEDDLYTDIYA